jgi:hypothetical protein
MRVWTAVSAESQLQASFSLQIKSHSVEVNVISSSDGKNVRKRWGSMCHGILEAIIAEVAEYGP